MSQSYTEWIKPACEQISSGAFLTTGQDHSPMTIGWCQFGVIWHKPVCTVLVRRSRYTHELLEKAETFTVSFPAPGTMKSELALCGTQSGRNVDKMQAAHLRVRNAAAGGADGVDGCAVYFECRLIHRADCAVDGLDNALRERYYAPGTKDADDWHTLYFGEILAAYGG